MFTTINLNLANTELFRRGLEERPPEIRSNLNYSPIFSLKISCTRIESDYCKKHRFVLTTLLCITAKQRKKTSRI